jgi:hypothetical protein
VAAVVTPPYSPPTQGGQKSLPFAVIAVRSQTKINKAAKQSIIRLTALLVWARTRGIAGDVTVPCHDLRATKLAH